MNKVVSTQQKNVSRPAMNQAGGILQRKCACGTHTIAGGECEGCGKEKNDARLQRAATGGAASGEAPPIVHDVLRSQGQPLDSSTRSFFEPRFGHDFSRVRLHTGESAAASALAVSALAYTVGNHIVLGAGQPSMQSSDGRKLMAHELAHVAQSGPHHHSTGSINISPPGSEFETEADEVADMIGRGERLSTRIKRRGQGVAMRALHRKLSCSLKHLDDECNNAAAKCAKVADECKERFPDDKAIEAQYQKTIAGAKERQSSHPNAAKNLLHFLDGSGTELVMPVEPFQRHPKTNEKLAGEHRDRFLAGAAKRLGDGRLVSGGTVDMQWTGTANALRGGSLDLGLAVSGYTICSNVTVKAEEAKPGTYKITFVDWTIQAFDCYNWDPSKGIMDEAFNHMEEAFNHEAQCCLQNAGRGKHFRIRTEEWKNTNVESMKSAEVHPTTPQPDSPAPKTKEPTPSGSAPDNGPGKKRERIPLLSGVYDFFSNIVQAISPGFAPETLQEYLDTILDMGHIEGSFDSDNKAYEVYKLWKNGKDKTKIIVGTKTYVLTGTLKALLAQELSLDGDAEEKRAAQELFDFKV